MRPRDAKTFDDCLKLRSDNVSTESGWMMVGNQDDIVTITQQRSGEPAEAMVHLPRREFSRMVDWYNRQQKSLKRRVSSEDR